MPESCFFTTTVLLILWIVTLTALIRTCLHRSKTIGKNGDLPPDLVIGVLSQGKKEADEARRRLIRLADTLFIGLVEVNNAGEIKGLNPVADELLDHGEKIETAIRTLSSAGKETVISTDNGKVFQVRHMETRDQDSTCLLVIQEVTRTYQWMERVKSQEKLALLGQMTAQIAHQLKTPLAVLAGRAQMLARHLANRKDLEIRAVEIYREARRLAEQVSEISTFYRERGTSPERTKLEPLFNQVKSRLKPCIKGQKISVACPLDLAIKTDPALLRNLIFLLAQNALEPEVAANHVRLDARIINKTAVIGVEDDGKGIPEKLKPRIFEPFVGTREDGLGLGLFLARDLAGQLGGSIKLADIPKGTRLEINLPL